MSSCQPHIQWCCLEIKMMEKNNVFLIPVVLFSLLTLQQNKPTPGKSKPTRFHCPWVLFGTPCSLPGTHTISAAEVESRNPPSLPALLPPWASSPQLTPHGDTGLSQQAHLPGLSQQRWLSPHTLPSCPAKVTTNSVFRSET